MLRIRVGRDEIRFVEEYRDVAEALARLLPVVRSKGQEVASMAARPLRVIVSAAPPPAREYYRVADLPLLLGLAATAVGIVLRQEVPQFIYLFCLVVCGLTVGMIGTAVVIQRLLARRMRAMWPNMGGVALGYNRSVPPVIILQWPRPAPLPLVTALAFPILEQEPYLAYILAHEYAHVLLRARYRKTRLPVWWDEGFAFWFAEQVMGQPRWRPESRAHLSAPEPSGNARRLFGQDDYVRLCARYYWEMRAIADSGLLPEVLKAPLSRVAGFRPELRAP